MKYAPFSAIVLLGFLCLSACNPDGPKRVFHLKEEDLYVSVTRRFTIADCILTVNVSKGESTLSDDLATKLLKDGLQISKSTSYLHFYDGSILIGLVDLNTGAILVGKELSSVGQIGVTEEMLFSEIVD